MKRKFLMIVLSAFLFSCGNSEKKSNESTSSDEVPACCKNKGNEATSSDNVPECCKNKGLEMLFPSEVSAKGDSYLGKEVAVRGFVKKVCHCSGKKCQLADNDESEISLTVFANDEIGKFSQELTGKNVKYIGVVKENRITKEMIAAEEAKQAEEAAKSNQNCDNGQGEVKEEKGHKHCGKNKDYSKMKKWMEENKKDYYPVYYVEVKNFEVMD
mgnify:FL=1